MAVIKITETAAKENFVRLVDDWFAHDGDEDKKEDAISEDKKEDAISAAIEYASILGMSTTSLRALYLHATGVDLVDKVNH